MNTTTVAVIFAALTVNMSKLVKASAALTVKETRVVAAQASVVLTTAVRTMNITTLVTGFASRVCFTSCFTVIFDVLQQPL